MVYSWGKLVVIYFLVLLVFLVIDFLWLGFIAKSIYSNYLGHLLKTDINWRAAMIFYCLFVVGLMIFAIMPGVAEQSWMRAMLLGGLFGFFTYATYDLTNLATLKDWPIAIVLIDIARGTVLGGAVSLVGYHIVQYIVS